MERNRNCQNCLNLTEVKDRGKPTSACRMGRRVFVAKPCEDQLTEKDNGGTFINLDDYQLWDEKLLGS